MKHLNTFTIVRSIKKFIYLLLAISVISCVNEVDENDRYNKTPIITDSISYLALGDSYTIGQGVGKSQRWPNQLGEELRGFSYKINRIDFIARTGWTSNNLLAAIDSADLDEYDLVSLQIGVNNQFQNRPFASFESELELLLNFSIETAGSRSRVFVVSIPDYGVTPFGRSNREEIGKEIDLYNEYIAAKCLERNIPFINITEISRELGSSIGALAPDNLHPSGDQYRDWVDEILPTALEILRK